MKKVLQLLFHRVVIVAVFIAIQVLILVGIIWKFNNYFVYFYGFSILLSVLVLLWIINNRSNPAYKIAWIIPILLFPIFGGLFYLMFGGNNLTQKTREKIRSSEEKAYPLLEPYKPLVDEIAAQDPEAANQSRYITQYAHCPPFRETSSEFLPIGEVKFERMVEELKKAEHFIFLEYFIIQEGKMWNTILDILKEKAAQGVDVRVMYDDVGCIMTLPYKYSEKLEAMGIKCCVFNPFIPILSSKLNNRDHRKICVIDGWVGFTGGINLADEYINEFEKHGHWKDCAVLLKGEGVWSLTLMFLSIWNYLRPTDEDYDRFRPSLYQKEEIEQDGYVQPFTDSPLDGETVGRTVYLNLINKATRYVYIATPYLIIDNEMITALTIAAKSGVDVRIITPHVADKWFVHAVTRAYYDVLVDAGVKIYEYTPGFIHAKTFAVDDMYGVVGTINLDYRSLYLHFECGAWLYQTKSVLDVKEDYLKTLEKCQEITAEQCRSVPWFIRLCRAVLRVFAPLM